MSRVSTFGLIIAAAVLAVEDLVRKLNEYLKANGL